MVMRLGETPVPISNTTVKTETADGTWWGTAWESRRLPAFIMKREAIRLDGFFVIIKWFGISPVSISIDLLEQFY